MTKKLPPDGDYPVGYAKPPKASQFAKGTSGNPQGRAKGSENFRDLFAREGAEMMAISENGTTKSITKQAALAKSVFQNAIKGNVPAAKLVLAALAPTESAASEGTGYGLTEADVLALESHADWVSLVEEARKEVANDKSS